MSASHEQITAITKAFSDEYTPAMAHAAVERGAGWLYEHCPDWPAHIDEAKLDLWSQTVCVLGQTAECLLGRPVMGRRFSAVLNHFQQSTRWAEAYGFAVPIHIFVSGRCGQECTGELRTRYEMLTIAWREYIRQRLGVPA